MNRVLRFGVHISWIFVFALVIAIVITQFSAEYPLTQRVLFGIIVSVLLLLASAGREYILNLAVFRRGSPARRMTLFVFGGVYRENPAVNPSAHLVWQYLARYLSSLLIAAVFYGLYATFINLGNDILAGMAQWLCYIFAGLFLLNFLPAFPLDGGDILRMVIWRISGDYYKATHIAALAGLAGGLLLLFLGVLIFIVTGLWLISLLLVVLGWVIAIAAGTIRRRMITMKTLQSIRAGDLMSTEFPHISGSLTIGQLVREHILIKGWVNIMVVDGDALEGVLSFKQVRSLPLKNWNTTTAGEIMTPCEKIAAASPQTFADRLYADMQEYGLDVFPVVEEYRLVGVVARSALESLVKIRTGLGI